MSVWHPGDEDALSFESNADPKDPRNIHIILDEQNPQQALLVRIGETTGTLAADEALTLLDWLGEREGILSELTNRQRIVLPDLGDEQEQS